MELADLNFDKLYTYADYYKWQFEEHVELIKGKIFKMSPAPNTNHQIICDDLLTLINTFLRKKPCRVFSAPFDVRLPRRSAEDKDIVTVLQPDVCVVCDKAKIDRRGCIGAPDLVIEVLSPGNSEKELRYKYEVYEEAGVKEYWVISPQNQHVLAYILQEGRYRPCPIKMPGDILTTPILSGLKISLTELFENISPEDD